MPTTVSNYVVYSRPLFLLKIYSVFIRSVAVVVERKQRPQPFRRPPPPPPLVVVVLVVVRYPMTMILLNRRRR